MTKITKNVEPAKIDASVEALKKFVKDASIDPLIFILEALKQDPNNESLLLQLSDTFKALGIIQGAVITYAPYISLLLSYDLFENHRK
jgi:hypothetical protein